MTFFSAKCPHFPVRSPKGAAIVATAFTPNAEA